MLLGKEVAWSRLEEDTTRSLWVYGNEYGSVWARKGFGSWRGGLIWNGSGPVGNNVSGDCVSVVVKFRNASISKGSSRSDVQLRASDK
jgi:hypothetical protein